MPRAILRPWMRTTSWRLRFWKRRCLARGGRKIGFCVYGFDIFRDKNQRIIHPNMISDYLRDYRDATGLALNASAERANRIKELLAQNPGNRHLLYFLALAQARDGFAADAVATLRR